MKERYLAKTTKEFLAKKMVFVGGPRQVGKTTMCLGLLGSRSAKNPSYLNWDDLNSKEILRKGLLPNSSLLVIDEIHKYKLWRNLLKGFYDKNKGHQNYLITGSARLDHYRKGGDSLLGRYRYLRLHPFSAGELKATNNSDILTLLKFGGFPEPFFSQSEKELKLWARERLYRIVNDDISDLENLKDYSRLELLADVLESKIASPLSLKSLEEDLSVSQKTIAHWVDIFDHIYYTFRISPYGAPKIRAVKKSQKIYFWDWSSISSPGARFENLVASQLLKYCHFLEDSEGEKMELRYLRDTDLREVDFVVLKNNKPLFAVECKTGEKQVAKSIHYYKDRTSIPIYYQVHLGKLDYQPEDKIRVLPYWKFTHELNMP